MTDFEQFWQAYPRKVGKLTALKSYRRAIQIVDPATILVGLERCKIGWSKRNEPQYIPHPTTWLNRGGWEDNEGPGPQMNGANDLVDNSGLFYAADGSAELAAWDRHWISTRGVHAPRDKKFGFWFPSRWPPS